jgi:hypothetical protein
MCSYRHGFSQILRPNRILLTLLCRLRLPGTLETERCTNPAIQSIMMYYVSELGQSACLTGHGFAFPFPSSS